MNYRETPVTPDLLALIWARLWDRGRQELERNGLTLNDGFWLFLNYAQAGRSGILLAADGEPVMVSGISQDDSGYFTWFQATDEFDKHAVAITRVLRREAKAHEGPLHIYSVLVHPKAARWFKALGFTQDEWEGRTKAGWPLYRFGRNVCA